MFVKIWFIVLAILDVEFKGKVDLLHSQFRYVQIV